MTVVAYAVAAAFGGVVPNRSFTSDSSPRPYRILLVNGPIHYDMFMPIDIARQRMGWLSAQGIALDHPRAEWLVVGWGAREFYTTVGTYADVTPQAIWRGLTGDSSVMRVTLAGSVSDEWRAVSLTEAQMTGLVVAVTQSFSQGDRTAALNHPGFSELDRFFPARGRFHLLKTCNAWVGAMLRAAGVRFGIWTPTPYAVTLAHRRFANE